jgi:hypothetical protein
VIALLMALAFAAEVHVVREGETIESIATELGDPALAAVVRGENGLAAGAQALPGTVLTLPPIAGHTDQEAMVIALSGSGEATLPSGTFPLRVQMALAPGAVACTAADGFATLRLAGDGINGHDDVNLMPSTCIRIVAVTNRPNSRSSAVEVTQGSIEIRASEGGVGAVTVLSEAGVTTGDSGGFRVALEDAGAARTEAIGGAVAVLGGGAEVAVSDGQGSRTIPGQAPSPPIDLLLPGNPTLPVDGGTLRTPDFEWTAVDGALGYRLQVAIAPDFSHIVFATESPLPELRADRLFLPYRVSGLWWRVTSFDLTGFEGPASTPRRVAFPGGIGQ